MAGSSSSPSHMADLAKQISDATSVLTQFLSSNGLPEPSFAPDAPLHFPPSPEDVQNARRVLQEATKELHELATGPSEHVRWLACWVCSHLSLSFAIYSTFLRCCADLRSCTYSDAFMSFDLC